jgi:integrase
MPSLLMRRGQRRYRARVFVLGVRGPSKWMPDDSKKSYRDAVIWEKQEAEKLRRKLERTRTESLTVRSWVNGYLDYVMTHGFAGKTYKEKKAAFEQLAAFSAIRPEMPVEAIDRFVCAEFYAFQMISHSGNAVNKIRKNLGAAWAWGRENLRDWPLGENPFLAVSKKQEVRHPRYVPPEADFWAVFDYVAGLAEDGSDVHVQDRVMLLAYLHLGARRSELFNATWSDVDFAGGQIRLWTRKREGGTKECDWLPLTKELQAELVMWAERRLAQATDDKAHVFVCLDTLPCTEQFYGLPFTLRRHAMGRWCAKAEVKAFGWHAIRHLTASILYRRGYGQGFIQAILRHRSPSTTALYMRKLGLNEVRCVLDDGLKREAVVIPFDQKKTALGVRS